MNEPKTYSATDIERYHSGQLSAAERHALEKAALADPFLADALDGYAFAQTPSADQAALQHRLQQRIGKEKKSRGVFYMANWMKIAAILVIVAGGGWLVIQLSNNNSETLATKQSPMATPSSSGGETVRDSTTVFSDAAVTAQAAQPTEKQKEEIQRKAIQDNVVVRQAPAGSTKPTPPAGIYLNKAAADSGKADIYASRAAPPMPGQLSEVTVSKPTGDAKAMDEERKDATAFKKPAAAPFEKNNRFISTDTVKNFNVTMRRTELPPEQTVVLKGRTREAPRAKRMNITLDSLEPAEGWTQFDDYVSNNIKEPEEIKAKQLTGEVELSFEVNGDGEPVNITVTRSLCDKCDEEAVRLLKEGPKWKKNKKKGKVKIKFPLGP